MTVGSGAVGEELCDSQLLRTEKSCRQLSPTQVLERSRSVKPEILETSHLPQPLSMIKQTVHCSTPSGRA